MEFVRKTVDNNFWSIIKDELLWARCSLVDFRVLQKHTTVCVNLSIHSLFLGITLLTKLTECLGRKVVGLCTIMFIIIMAVRHIPTMVVMCHHHHLHHHHDHHHHAQGVGLITWSWLILTGCHPLAANIIALEHGALTATILVTSEISGVPDSFGHCLE